MTERQRPKALDPAKAGRAGGGRVDPRPTVGLFDSGVGGLSVLRHMLEVKTPPWGRIIYLADLGHFPYGPRPAPEVRSLALAGVGLLASRGAAVVAVACNTAASSGVRAGEVAAAVPVLDIIGPGARQLGQILRLEPPRQVVILGTEGTVRGRVWERELRAAGYRGRVVGWACPFLANLIEEGRNGLVARRAVHDATSGLGDLASAGPDESPVSSAKGFDLVVLGCTHYPFAAETIRDVLAAEVLGRPVRVVDPSGALAAEIAARLAAGRGSTDAGAAEGVAAPSAEDTVEVLFLTTGKAGHFRRRATQLLADKLASGAAGGRIRLRLDEVAEVSLPASPA